MTIFHQTSENTVEQAADTAALLELITQIKLSAEQMELQVCLMRERLHAITVSAQLANLQPIAPNLQGYNDGDTE